MGGFVCGTTEVSSDDFALLFLSVCEGLSGETLREDCFVSVTVLLSGSSTELLWFVGASCTLEGGADEVAITSEQTLDSQSFYHLIYSLFDLF